MTPSRHDDGFTLIESVIAMLIMSIAVVTIVGALATLIQLVGSHRGQAVAETGARSFAQAVQAQAQFSTTLDGDVAATASVLPLDDASLFPPAGEDTFATIGREVVRVELVTRGADPSIRVERDVNGDAASGAADGTAVVPFTRCAPSASLTPPGGSYEVANGATPTVNGVEYWSRAASSFVGRNACLTEFADRCELDSEDLVLPECATGLMRVTLGVTTTGDTRLDGVDTTTTVLVRRGSE